MPFVRTAAYMAGRFFMDYVMRYRTPAEDSEFGWEHQSLPIGCGYFGANVFGMVERERIQITENSLENSGALGGLNNFAELYLHFPHSFEEAQEYERGLRLNNGVAWCRYTYDGITYEREYFASYPDRALVVRIGASRPGSVSFRLEGVIPFVKDYAKEPGDGGGKSGQVEASGYTLTMKGVMHYYEILFEGQARVFAQGGTVRADGGCIVVDGADWAYLVYSPATNYVLCPEVFLEEDPKKKLKPVNPHEELTMRLDRVCEKSYEELKAAHEADFTELFGRVELLLEDETAADSGVRTTAGGGSMQDGVWIPSEPTDVLLADYQKGAKIPYLEMVYYQYGRYLLISSSRPGTLPANLQGVWNCHDQSPWGSGYWHNINVQMNYWPAFSANLAETFQAYAEFNKAFRPKTEQMATEYIRAHNPEKASELPGECGWTIGTASYAYYVTAPGGHSGPGTGGLTTKLFWDYYDFTRDEDVLKEVTWPVLSGMSRFLTKTVKKYDGDYLTLDSASPEQMLNRKWVPRGQYYTTIGCAFDQQMIWENGKDMLRAAELLGMEQADPDEAATMDWKDSEQEDICAVQRRQQDHYKPVEIGWSGQVKEYSEERFYGEIGQYNHRHISQLVGLFPGSCISNNTPAWMDAAKLTLTMRGDESTGWALAHRICAWARTGDGDHAYSLVRNLLGMRTMDNLWDFHPPFQIDGNFGGTAGITEMLLQSHEGYVSILPALPAQWKSGSCSGLVARGNFEVSISWKDGCAKTITVLARSGGVLELSCPGITAAAIEHRNAEGRIERAAVEIVPVTGCSVERVRMLTAKGDRIIITNIPRLERAEKPERFSVRILDKVQDGKRRFLGVWLDWKSVKAVVGGPNVSYRVWRAIDQDSDYELLAEVTAKNKNRLEYLDPINVGDYDHITYKLTAVMSGRRESEGCLAVVNHASELERDRYERNIRVTEQ